MNRDNPWDWSTPFNVDPHLQALSAQINPIGGQSNAQVPPPSPPHSSPIQQAMTNKAMNAGFKQFDGVPHDPTKVEVEDAVPTPVDQVGAPMNASIGDTQLASNATMDAQAQALLEEQMAQQGSGSLMSMFAAA